MGTFQVGGLASGLDTTSLISQLMAVESKGLTKLKWRSQLWNVRQKGWQDLNTRLGTLQSMTSSLTSVTSWSPSPTVASSDAGKVSGMVNGPSPAAGNYQVTTSQLATTAVWTASASGGSPAGDTLTITQGASNWNINIAPGATDADIRDAINAEPGIGVTASLVGGMLRVQANATGAGQDFTMSSAGTLAGDLGLSQSVVGVDANFTVNGAGYTRSSNTVTDVISDVSFTLHAVTGAAVNLDVTDGSASADTMKSKLKDFVNQYNSVIDFIHAKTSEKKVLGATNMDDFLKGSLSNDSGFRSVEADLRRWVNDIVAGLPDGMNSLADIGISTGAWTDSFSPGNVSGKLKFDEAAFDAAFAADPTGVEKLLRNGNGGATLADQGVMARMNSLITQLRTGGRVDAAIDGASSQMDAMQKAMDRMNYRLGQKQAQYERMFANLEGMLANIQSQGNWLQGQLGSLPTAGNLF